MKRRTTNKALLLEPIFDVAPIEKMSDIVTQRDEVESTGKIYTESSITVKYKDHSCVFKITRNNLTEKFHAVRYDMNDKHELVSWDMCYGKDLNQFFHGSKDELATWIRSVWDESAQAGCTLADRDVTGVGCTWLGPKNLDEPYLWNGKNYRKLFNPEQIRNFYLKK